MADHGWVIAVDGEGAEYFFNNNTQESAWELPEGVDPATVKKQAKWQMIEDGGSFYFYNNVTGDSVWEKPDDFDGIDLTPVVEEGEEGEDSVESKEPAAAAAAPAAAEPAKAQESDDGPAGDESKGEGAGEGGGASLTGVIAAKKMATKWLAVVDEDSGATYYYNNKTGDCQWEKPDDFDGAGAPGASKEEMQKILKAKLRLAALDSDTRNKIKAAQAEQKKAKEAGKMDWVECYDPSSDAFYYTSKSTGATTWDKPENYIMAADDEMMHAVVKIQCMFRGKIARGEVVIKEKKKKEKWMAVEDESGGTYYYNNETGECQWDKPADYFGATAEGASKEEMEKILKAKLRLAALDSETRNKIKAAQAEQKKAKAEGKMDWVECYDPSSDAFYYTSKSTGETTWDKPENYIMAADDEMMHAVVKIQCMFRGKIARGEVKIKVWQEIEDEETGQSYYHNKKTGEITWERPDELGGPIIDPEEALRRKEQAGENLTKVLSMKLKEARLDDDTRKRLKEAKERQRLAKEAGLVGEWVECFDPSSDGFYYYNATSNETTWDKPKNYVMAADDETMHAVVKIQCMYRARLARRRAKGMITQTRAISSDRHQEALDRMKRLNEEEMEMKRQMEKLKKDRDFKHMSARQKQKAIEEAKARAAEELAEKEREDARKEKEMDFKRKIEAKRERKRVEEELRKMRRKKRLAEIEKKMKRKRELERMKKEEEDKKRAKEREIRQMKRATAKRLAKEKWKKDCAAWKKQWTKAKKDEATRKRERDAAAHKEFLQARADKTSRERFAERRAQRHDNAILSIWDAAMHGVTRERVNVLLNLAIAEGAQTQAKEAESKEPAEVIAGELRSHAELSAGVGTAPQSRALYNIDMGNEVGESPLHVAAWRGNLSVVEALIQRGANVNLTDTVYLKVTPLHEAVRGGWRKVASALVSAGADLTAQDCTGDTPLHIACRQGDVGMAGVLLDADADKKAAHVQNYKKKYPGDLATTDAMRLVMAGFVHEPAPRPSFSTVPSVSTAAARRTGKKGRRKSRASRRGSVGRNTARRSVAGSVRSGAGGWR